MRRECPRTVRETYRDNCVISAGVVARARVAPVSPNARVKTSSRERNMVTGPR